MELYISMAFYIELALIFILTLLALFFGEKILVSELHESDYENTGKPVMVWRFLCFLSMTVVTAMSFHFIHYFRIYEVVMLLYVFLYCSLVAIVDYCTHDYYVELMYGAALFPVFGIFSFDIIDAFLGMIAGFCISLLIVCLERICTGDISYGGGDIVFGVAALGLLGFNYTNFFWMLFAVLAFVYAITIIGVTMVKYHHFEKSAKVALLPVFCISTSVLFAVRLIETRCGMNLVSQFNLF